jgi:hypothetical protein
MRYLALALTLIFIMTFSPMVTTEHNPDVVASHTSFSLADDGLVEGVPYVWQEINGFCAWAATSIAFQAAGVDADLHDIFALSTIGFSFAYIRFNDTLLLAPGAVYDQVLPVDFAADLYGVNYTQYFDQDISGASQIEQVYTQLGVNTGFLNGEQGALELMRETIDSGYPLLISVDPIWLPAEDYDYLREIGASGGGHGVLIVGYNDTSSSVKIIDPGVGAFGNNFGYPADGRGNYTEVLYTSLLNAWSARSYISSTFIPQGSPVADFSDQLGMMIRDKLLGVGTTYSPASSNAYLWSFGEAGFRDMSEHFTSSGLLEYFSVYASSAFDTPEEEKHFKSALLLLIGLGVESTITLQYLSYRTAIERVPELMPDRDMQSFHDAAELALPHMDALSSNTSLVFPGNLSKIDGLVSTTFYDISQEYNSTGDLEGTLNDYATELGVISNHLLGIADSWAAAGNALAVYWPNNPFLVYAPVLIIFGAAAAVTIVVIVMKIRKTPSQ